MFKIIKFFEYNWQVRDEWFEWCNQLTTKELLEDRIGGVGNILFTLFHIIDVEYSWIRGIQGKEDVVFQFDNYNTLEKVKSLSDKLRNEIAGFLRNTDDLKGHSVSVPWDESKYAVTDVIYHIISHEIHHIGQLSVWSRELELPPASSHFVGRELKSIYCY